MLEFGKKNEFKGYCWCGLPLLSDGACSKYHKAEIKKQRIKKYSGKSKSINKYNEYD